MDSPVWKCYSAMKGHSAYRFHSNRSHCCGQGLALAELLANIDHTGEGDLFGFRVSKVPEIRKNIELKWLI